ncbi:MAG TPA: twin-arginine translocase TatA/TatE family subunit [Terriglobia bacterium]|jgi:TatA/E family protein of Tat protein translocase
MGSLGFPEMLMIFVIALLVFGPKKLPELGKSLGKGIREFKKATDELKANWEDHVKDIAEPLNDAKKELHGMGQSLKTQVYNHIEGATQTEPTELAAPAEAAAATAEAHEATATHPAESSTPKEHV